MAFIGWPELVLILIILIFLFGAARLTGLGRALGQAVREFRKASSGEGEKAGKEQKEKKSK